MHGIDPKTVENQLIISKEVHDKIKSQRESEGIRKIRQGQLDESNKTEWGVWLSTYRIVLLANQETEKDVDSLIHEQDRLNSMN
jgi:hypothetical protein